MIETSIYKIERGEFGRLLFAMYGGRWIAVIALSVFLCLIAGIVFDWRFLFLALIIIALIAPPIVMFLYFNYGMKGKNYLNILDHKLSISDTSLKVTLYPYVKEEDRGDRIGKEMEDKSEDERLRREKGSGYDDEAEGDAMPRSREYEYSFADFGGYLTGKGSVIFPFLPPNVGFLVIPEKSFANHDDFIEAIRLISGGAHYFGRAEAGAAPR
ncbi:MAG: hypothetical protein K2J23_04275 [Muribaculaceae bacterium]|nr:hypothetical protein [Muribaculaceae bacterium]